MELQTQQKNTGVKDDGKKFGLKTAASLAVGTAAVAALLIFQRCGGEPKTDSIIHIPEKVVAVCPEPVKGDGKCESNKGENDPMTKMFSGKDCGVCGDGKAEVDKGENAGLCPVDFHCGNGKVDQNAPYAAMVEVKNQPGAYVWRSVTITESCAKDSPAYCEADCPKEGGKKVSGHRREPKEIEVAPPSEPVVKGGPCPGTNERDGMMKDIRDAIDGAAPSIRKELTSDNAATVKVSVTVNVSEKGKPTGLVASATCTGPCDSPSAKVTGVLGFDYSSYELPPPGEKCKVSVSKPASSSR